MRILNLLIVALIVFTSTANAEDVLPPQTPINEVNADSVEERRLKTTIKQEELSLENKLRNQADELEKKELALKLLKSEVDREIRRLEGLRSDVKKLFAKVTKEEKKRISELSRFYSKMDPAAAAQVLQNLNKDQTVKILAGMKDKSAGKILGNMHREAAAKITLEYAKYLKDNE